MGSESKGRKGRRRHIPQRTCVGCRVVHPKRDMVRVVRTAEGVVEIDPSGKRAGRGAYLCRQKKCWETALRRQSLDCALKTVITDVAKETLSAYAAQLSAEPTSSHNPAH